MSRVPFPLDGAAALRHPPRVRCLLPLALVLPACTATPTPISIDVTTGQETTAFADAAVTAVTVAVTSLDGTVHATSTVSPDGGAFDLGDIANTEQVCVAATGYTSDKTAVMSGQTLTGLLLSSIPSDIPVFIQRIGQWARPPGGLASSHVGGVATVVAEHYLLLTGGARATKDTTSNPTGVDAYDLFALGGDVTAPAFDPVPSTMVPVLSTTADPDVQILLINDGVNAFWLDYSTGVAATAGPPMGLTSFGDVAGGAVVNAANGTVYVVGAAQSGAASNAVLEVDSDGGLVGYTLSTKRQGAATTWVSGLGLVVAGGSSGGAGVEVPVREGTASFQSSNYPADPTVGAGAVSDGTNGFYLVGGTLSGGLASTRHFLAPGNCGTSCAPTPLPWATLPVALHDVTAYQLGVATPCSTSATQSTQSTGSILVVGEGAAGTLSFVIDINTKTVTAVPLREPRRGATPIPAPNGTLALLGGEHLDGTPALSIELFAP